MLKYPQQAKGWKRVPWFWNTRVLSAPKGNYVELTFTMRSSSWAPRPCLQDYYLEIRDGSNQSANVLGVFCGDHKTAVVRSSGRYLWLRFFPDRNHLFSAYYTGRSFNQTGTWLKYLNSTGTSWNNNLYASNVTLAYITIMFYWCSTIYSLIKYLFNLTYKQTDEQPQTEKGRNKSSPWLWSKKWLSINYIFTLHIIPAVCLFSMIQTIHPAVACLKICFFFFINCLM